MLALVATTWDTGDTLTYYYDKDTSVTVTAGELVNGLTVDKDNIVQALTYKINNNSVMQNNLIAYNGQYSIDEDGNKILMSPQTDDH